MTTRRSPSRPHQPAPRLPSKAAARRLLEHRFPGRFSAERLSKDLPACILEAYGDLDAAGEDCPIGD